MKIKSKTKEKRQKEKRKVKNEKLKDKRKMSRNEPQLSRLLKIVLSRIQCDRKLRFRQNGHHPGAHLHLLNGFDKNICK
jgi:hypothetical protein